MVDRVENVFRRRFRFFELRTIFFFFDLTLSSLDSKFESGRLPVASRARKRHAIDESSTRKGPPAATSGHGWRRDEARRSKRQRERAGVRPCDGLRWRTGAVGGVGDVFSSPFFILFFKKYSLLGSTEVSESGRLPAAWRARWRHAIDESPAHRNHRPQPQGSAGSATGRRSGGLEGRRAGGDPDGRGSSGCWATRHLCRERV